MSKRKKSTGAPASPPGQDESADHESVTTRAAVPSDVLKEAIGASDRDVDLTAEAEVIPVAEAIPEAEGVPVDAEDFEAEHVDAEHVDAEPFDAEMTVNLSGELPIPGRDDLDAPTVTVPADALSGIDSLMLQRKHLRGLLEALVFASDSPITPKELAKLASAPQKQVKELLAELKVDYATRGMHLDEVAGGWVFRTSPQYAPFVRDLTKQKPVRLTRAQVETLAIIAYRQPITRPEIDDVRGVDSGPVLKLLLERDLVRILGKRDEPGRPLIYGSTSHFLEFFGLKSLKDLPTLREFTELSDESREAFEDELGEGPEDAALREAEAEVRAAGGEEQGQAHEHRIDDEHELEHELDDEHEERSVHESMRVPIGEQAVEDLGDDDLEPIDVVEALESDAPEQHASDDDGPTLTSEAPPGKNE